ncbi:CDP-diacylglycerol--serine O-phosphatidyltransferase [candidate division KSB1 bacterium]|nr:CDP-diacylglycerol--serine O-phosphatidyltransferase [candidate division KSB1 bacterium]RQW01661.1 MAG: CDP-diacylglycerol--serine O-phosphatidyltransferase [candidate division KSB1 bacterium]
MYKTAKQYISVPNLFTTINLFCGFLSVIMTVAGKFVAAGWIIFMAGIFDALDGRIARASGRNSDFGLQMDSLADVISAGIAPSILLYEYYFKDIGNHIAVGMMLGFLPLLFATFRLARYNVMTQHEGHKSYYVGMPAPMAASTLASLVILHNHVGWPILLRLMLVSTPVISLAMASHLKYEGFPRFSVKEKGGNRFKLVIFFTGIVFVFFFPEFTLFIFMFIYFISGPTTFLYNVFRTHDQQESILESDEFFADQRVP